MRVAKWTLPLIVVGGALAFPGVAAAESHHCASVTIGDAHFTHVVAKGVKCAYVTGTFIPAVNANGSVPGWGELQPKHVTATETKDRFEKGKKEISLTFTLG
jgi:hypothetical protein